MPIVNGTYVPTTLGSPKDVQNQVFGEYTRRDMSDYSTAAYNYLQKQQEQAYNLDLWNLQNEYNSPAAQMQRFQDAGLNPNLIYSQQNVAQSPASASAASFRPGYLRSKQSQNAISAIGQMMSIVKAARETYDYMKFGRETSAWNRNLAMWRSSNEAYESWWNSFLLGVQHPYGPLSPDAPKVKMYQYQTDTQQQRFEQLKAVVATIPDQQERTRALSALDRYRLQILQGQNSAILSINTGSQGLDSFLKMLGFYLLGH